MVHSHLIEPVVSAEAWRATGRTWRFGDHEIFYRDEGMGTEAVLLVHGFPTASWDWHQLWPRLSQGWRLVAPDLIGYGFSSKPRGYRYTVAEQADLCEALTAYVGLSRYHVLAHDYGDTVVQELLSRSRSRNTGQNPVLSVTLLNGGIIQGAYRPRLIQRLLAGPAGPLLAPLLTRPRVMGSLCAVFGEGTQPGREEQAALWQIISEGGGQRNAPALLGYLRERRRHGERWARALTEATVPMQFINGVDDPVSGGAMADAWAALLPGAPLHRLPGIGHYPQLEAPATVLEAVEGFLARVSST